jgi:hypothetical protein
MNIFTRGFNFIKRFLVRLSITNYISSRRRNRIQQIRYNSEDYIFATPNELCKWRVKTFSSKEPETLAWIDSFKPESIFWDIGANLVEQLYANFQIKYLILEKVLNQSIIDLDRLAKSTLKLKGIFFNTPKRFWEIYGKLKPELSESGFKKIKVIRRFGLVCIAFTSMIYSVG